MAGLRSGIVDVSVDQAKLDRLMRKLAPAQLNRAWRDGMEDSLAFLKRAVQENTNVDRGMLRGGIFTEIHGTTVDSMFGRVLPSPATKEYASVQEWGRKPGGKMPPVTVIADWARRKGITVSAFVIARSIARKGTKGKFMFRDAARKGQTQVVRIMARQLKRWAAS